MTALEYGAKNRLTQVTDPINGVTQYTYDGNGNLLTVKDAKNQMTTFAYDSRNRLLSTTDPLGKVETYEYDGNDNLTKRITPKLDQIVFAYDAVNQLLSKTLPGNLLTSYQYDLVGNVTNVTDPDSVLTMTYDQANRLLTTSTAGSSNQPTVTLTTGYDKNSNRLSLTDPTGQTSYAYDTLNRLTTLASPHPGSCQAPSTTGLVSWWKAEGNANDSAGSNQGIMQITFSGEVPYAPGRIGQAFSFQLGSTHVSIPHAASLTFTNTDEYSLDFWMRTAPHTNVAPALIEKWDELSPTWGSVPYPYVVRLNPPDGTIVGASWDGTNFAGAVSQTRVDNNQWHHVTVVFRHPVKRIDLYVDGALQGTTTYTTLGPLSNTIPVALGRRPTQGEWALTKYAGLLDELKLYNRALTAQEIQALGCQDGTTFAYDALSRRTSLTRPNDTQTTYTYDPASQVQSILHQLGASGSTINQAVYTYNGVGNRESLTDRRGVQNFGYDNLDRLTSASHPLLGTPQSFTYDPVGNRTIAGNVTNAANQLTADATHSYQYDDNGNLTRKTLLATGNYTEYTYDAENRLVKVEDFAAGNSTPAFTSTYRYDGLGRRIEKVANASTSSAGPGQTKRYIYDGKDILLEYDGSNVLQARYTHGPGIDEPIAVTKGANTFFYHQDGLGSVTDLTDSAGATAKSYSYDAYGNILESPGTLEQPYTYTGREFDSESGLYYYRARYYDSVTGRFLQKDPIGFKGGDANLYRYVSNNPVSFNDPLGLQCSCGEEITAIAAVGPVDAYRARQVAEEAARKADSTGFPGRQSGVQDAFRHCYWSCRMAQEIGPEQAKKVGDIHEECQKGTSEAGDTAMDLKNNSVGRALGTPGTDCYFSCGGGVKSGALQTSPGGTPPIGPIY